MKLTWFGGSALRIYIGGEIVVVDAGMAPAGIDPMELTAGAGRLVTLRGDPAVPRIDASRWRQKPPPTALDGDRPTELEILGIAEAGLLIAAAGEPPLVVLGAGQPPAFGRWADGAVIVLTSAGEGLVSETTVLLDVARPKLIALAADEQTLDLAIAELGEHLGGTGLVSLEPGLALEV